MKLGWSQAAPAPVFVPVPGSQQSPGAARMLHVDTPLPADVKCSWSSCSRHPNTLLLLCRVMEQHSTAMQELQPSLRLFRTRLSHGYLLPNKNDAVFPSFLEWERLKLVMAWCEKQESTAASKKSDMKKDDLKQGLPTLELSIQQQTGVQIISFYSGNKDPPHS